MPKLKNNAYVFKTIKEKDGKKYINFYLSLGRGLGYIPINVKDFDDSHKNFITLNRYCESEKK